MNSSIIKILGAVLLGSALLSSPLADALVSNKNPSFTRGEDVFVLEDSGTYQQAWATAITDGEVANPNSQSLTFIVTPSDSQLFSVQPAINDQGVLTFTTKKDKNGPTQVTVVLKDDGASQCTVDAANGVNVCPGDCTPLDCSSSSTDTFTITIGPVNDCPTFSHRGDQTVNEDPGSVTVTGWLHSISEGAANENGQTLTWSIVNDNNALFSVQPTIDHTGGSTTANLRYKPVDNAYGVANVVVHCTDDAGTPSGGCDRSINVNFAITVQSVNDNPTFNAGPSTITINEDHGPYQYSKWATTMYVGAPNEDTQQISFTTQFVDGSHSSMFSSAPTIDTSGTLSFEAKPDVNTATATVEVYVQLRDDGGGKSCNPITACGKIKIVINSINDVPSFALGSNVEVWEDLLNMATPPSPLTYTQTNWATSISTGNLLEAAAGEGVSFVLSNNMGTLFSTPPAIDSQGTLTFTLNQDKNGAATVTAQIKDSKGLAGNQGTFLINVLSSNDAPTFSFKNNGNGAVTVNEDVASFTEQTFLNGIGKARSTATDETGQQLWVTTTTSQSSLFSVQPSVTFTTTDAAKLSFVPAANKYGTATVSVTVKDNGGTDRAGVDQTTKSFTITINPVNDAPSFTLSTTMVTVIEDQYPAGFSKSNMLTLISPGPEGEASSQTVSVSCSTTDSSLFTTQPKIDTAGTLTFTPTPNAFGETTVTVTVTDSETPALSVTNSFSIRILAKNDAPTFTKGFALTGTKLAECRSVSPCTYSYSQWATGITTGDTSKESSQTLAFSVSSDAVTANLFSTHPTINPATGTLSFALRPLQNTASSGTLTVSISLADNGGVLNGGVDTSTQTLAIEVPAFVDNPSFSLAALSTSCDEDAALQTYASFLTSIATGVTGETTLSNILFHATATDTTLFSTQPSIVASGSTAATLTYKPTAHKSGSSKVTVVLEHKTSGKTSTEQFTIVVNAVNDQPTFTLASGNVEVYVGSGDYTGTLISSYSTGTLEQTQSHSFQITCDAVPASLLFVTSPAIDTTGTLTFSLTPTGLGTCSCTVTMKDTGGTLKGGIDTSASKSFFVVVGPMNHAPTFSVGPDLTINEDHGVHSHFQWMTAITTGPGDATTQQTVAFTTCSPTTMFSAQPAVETTYGTLSFATAADQNGIALCQVYLEDNGPSTLPDVNRSAAKTFRIIVAAVNDPPTFTMQATALSLLEDAAPYSQGNFMSAISPGPTNEASQTLTWTIVASPTTLFTTQPALSAAGTLSFALVPHASGLSTLTACLIDNGEIPATATSTTCKTVSVSVAAVNDKPEADANITVTQLEDAGPIFVDGLFSVLTPGPSEMQTQQIASITASYFHYNQVTCTALFVGVPTFNTAGRLTFQSAANQNGQCYLNITIVDTAGLSTYSTLKAIILPVNDAPSAGIGPEITIKEGSTDVRIGSWMTNMKAGPANEANQVITATVSVADASLFLEAPTIEVSSGSLLFSLRETTVGPISFTIVLKDDGGTANGGVDSNAAVPYSSRLHILTANDMPSFNLNANVLPLTVLEDAGFTTVQYFAKDISAGTGTTEVSQSVSFEVTVDKTDFFTTFPQISNSTGSLTFQTAPNKYGKVLLNISLSDNGGSLNGGLDITAVNSVELDIVAVNDAPSFIPASTTVYVLEDHSTSIEKWIGALGPGPFEDAQSVSLSSYSPQYPTVSALKALLSSVSFPLLSNMTIDPADDYFGTVPLMVRATDSGDVSNAGQNLFDQAVNVVVLPVNDAPTFTTVSSVTATHGDGKTSVPSFVSSVSAGPTNEKNQTVTLSVYASDSAFFTTQPTLTSSYTLNFVVNPAKTGTTTLVVTAVDNGNTNNGGTTTTAKVVTFNLQRATATPTFNTTYLALRATTTSTVSNTWATDIKDPDSPGGTVVFLITANTAPTLFSKAPSVSSAGVLSFSTANTPGTSSLSIVAVDVSGLRSPAVVVSITVRNPDMITVVLNMESSAYSTPIFQQKMGLIFNVVSERIVVHSVLAGSVTVTFYVSGEDTALTAEDFVARTKNTADPLHSVGLGITSAKVEPPADASSSGGNAAAATEAPAEEDTYLGLDRDTFIIVIIVSVVILILIILLIVMCVCLSKKDDKKENPEQDQQNKTSAPPPDNDGEFDDVSKSKRHHHNNRKKNPAASPYGEEEGLESDASLPSHSASLRTASDTPQHRGRRQRKQPSSYSTPPEHYHESVSMADGPPTTRRSDYSTRQDYYYEQPIQTPPRQRDYYYPNPEPLGAGRQNPVQQDQYQRRNSPQRARRSGGGAPTQRTAPGWYRQQNMYPEDGYQQQSYSQQPYSHRSQRVSSRSRSPRGGGGYRGQPVQYEDEEDYPREWV